MSAYQNLDDGHASVGMLVRRHALIWLVLANLVGVLLASELVWPVIGDVLAPLSYGRWMPLHTDWQLYGWCSLPLVGMLMHSCLTTKHPQITMHAGVALGVWGVALAVGGLSWLEGGAGGKLFLNWNGWTRFLLPVAMIVLWTILAAHVWWGYSNEPKVKPGHWLLLAMLVTVPPLLYWSSGAEVFPSVNPDSGGATGASLLGSTLGILFIYGLLPVLLGIKFLNPSLSRIWQWTYWLGMGLTTGVFLVLNHGNASHHELGQILGLGCLLGWGPLLILYWREYDWPGVSGRWLLAGAVWWAVLSVSGWITFLPECSESLKFTNGLVSHAHLAMAGMVTSVNMGILNAICPDRPLFRGFKIWQAACVLHVIVLMIAGMAEANNPAGLFYGFGAFSALYAIRLFCGAVMCGVSIFWLKEALT